MTADQIHTESEAIATPLGTDISNESIYLYTGTDSSKSLKSLSKTAAQSTPETPTAEGKEYLVDLSYAVWKAQKNPLEEEVKEKSHDAPVKSQEQSVARNADTGYIDGLRGLAMIMVFNEHYFTHTFTTLYPGVLEPRSAREIIRSKIGLVLFFMLSGRLNVASYFARRGKGKPLPWSNLGDAMFRRTWRIGVMTAIAAIGQKLECAGGLFYPAQRVTSILKIGSALSYPSWCTLTKNKYGYVVGTSTSFSQIAISVLKVFTNRDHIFELKYEGMLWSMYTQLWGMFYVLALLPVVMALPPIGRQIFYLLLLIVLASTYSIAQPFVLGLIISDWKESGYLEKLRLKSRALYISCEVSLIALFMIFLCYNRIETAMINALAPITFREGFLGVNVKVDDFAGSPAILLRTFILFLWVEMSIMAQWIIGNWLLKALGRVALGFYVAQLPIIFGIMPPLVYKFADQGHDYWSIISYNWVICFIINYCIGWLANFFIDRWALRSGKWMAKNLQQGSATGFIINLLRLPITFFSKDLPAYVASRPSSISQLLKKSINSIKDLQYWRTPNVQRDPISPPLIYGFSPNELHSTFFNDETVVSAQATKSFRMLRVSGYLAPFYVSCSLGFGFIWAYFNPWAYYTTEQPAAFSLLWRFLWVLSFPFVIITLIGFGVPDYTRSRKNQNKQKVYREDIHKFYIVSVTRGTNEEATRRSHQALKVLEACHPAVEVIVLTDEPYVYPDLNNIVTPKAYKSPKGLANHKARALDYFRSIKGLTPYDWVLHMDEESTMDASGLRACFDLVRYTPHDFGQGLITYNAHNYRHHHAESFVSAVWSWIFSSADSLRVADDMARFSLQTNWIKRPLFGVHGSFLLVNGECENDVGWDFGSLTEDFEFSQVAWRKGYTLGRIHGVVREQSPQNLTDFLKQRRRWYMGVAQLGKRFLMPRLGIKVWTGGVFCLVGTGLNLLFSFLPTGNDPCPYWLYAISCTSFGVFNFAYLIGTIATDMDYYPVKQWWRIPLHCLATLPLTYINAVIEAIAVIWAISSDIDNVGFEVVKK